MYTHRDIVEMLLLGHGIDMSLLCGGIRKTRYVGVGVFLGWSVLDWGGCNMVDLPLPDTRKDYPSLLSTSDRRHFMDEHLPHPRSSMSMPSLREALEQ